MASRLSAWLWETRTSHPVDGLLQGARRWSFLAAVIASLLVFLGLLRIGQPLNCVSIGFLQDGIVAFELARTPEVANSILDAWSHPQDHEICRRHAVPPDTLMATGEVHRTDRPGAVSELRESHLIARAGLSVGLDFLFIPLYVITFSGLCLLAAETLARFAQVGWASLGIGVAWLVVVAGGLDIVENIGLVNMLMQRTDSAWPSITYGCAFVKFAILLLFCGPYLTLAWPAIAWLSLRRRNT